MDLVKKYQDAINERKTEEKALENSLTKIIGRQVRPGVSGGGRWPEGGNPNYGYTLYPSTSNTGMAYSDYVGQLRAIDGFTATDDNYIHGDTITTTYNGNFSTIHTDSIVIDGHEIRIRDGEIHISRVEEN